MDSAKTTTTPVIGIYIIGDEILSGKRKDAHLGKVIELLSARGMPLGWAHYLADDPAQITAALKMSFQAVLQKDAIVFSFGGIGATPDDYTRQCAAAALDLPLIRHADAVAEIEAQFGEGAYPKRVLMADFPAGADLIPNPVNRVAGFSIQQHYFLPGFPEMAHPMMEWVLENHYQQLFHQIAYCEKAIIIPHGVESQLIDLMHAILKQYPAIKVFSLPRLKPERQVELGVKGEPAAVDLAMREIKAAVSQMGLDWHDAV